MAEIPYRTFIVDDETGARSIIKGFLKQSFPEIIISGEVSGVEEALHMIPKLKIDLVFLDVEMGDGTGFMLLDKLPDLDFNVIFTTAHDEFAIRAFRYNAIDFLLKPIDPDEFVIAVHKAKEHQNFSTLHKQFAQLLTTAQNNTFDRITLNTGEGHVFAKTNDIIRIETYGNYSFVFLAKSERLLVSRNLKEFEEMLPEPDFFRVHQSHIINTTFVKKILKEDGGYVIMNDDTKIPISRRRKEDFMKIIKL
ncbi:MAG TPA: LytTR family DNA-binding domain-containing protein [Saprospiraceae bacterium]|nr:LytTR family DNA-binding domain-containing protein [Saprospiraceae bacterium]